MSGEQFDGQDAGYVPENPDDFPQNNSDEIEGGNVIDDDSGFPQLQPDDVQEDVDVGVGDLAEDANPPEGEFDGGHDVVEDLPGNDVDDSLPPELTEEQEQHDGGGITEEQKQHDGGGVTEENFGSPEKQVPGEDLKGSEIKKWPGWPGENVFRMLVPAQKVGSIIGRKGEFIKKITEETKARIKILDGPPGTAERAVSILFNFLLLFLQ